MAKRFGWLMAAFGLLFLAHTAPAAAGEARSSEEIERIVREYLLREPEIIMEAIEELQRRRESASAAEQRERLSTERESLVADPRDPILGDSDGDVTLVEFFDYRCGYCRAMAAPLQQLLDDDPDLRVVMKEFPILGADSLLASKAALAAKAQGGYARMHWALLGQNRIDADVVRRLADEQGLDTARLFADMESEPVLEHIQDNLRLAQALGVNGTPTFVINETVLPGAVPLDRLTELLAAERAREQG